MSGVRAADQPVQAQVPVGCKVPDPDLPVAGLVIGGEQAPIQGKVGGKGGMSPELTAGIPAEHSGCICPDGPKGEKKQTG